MSEVKRYRHSPTQYARMFIDTLPSGEYVTGADYDALAAKAERYIQEGISLADQRDALAADNQLMRDLLRQLWDVSSNGWKTKIDAALAGSKEVGDE